MVLFSLSLSPLFVISLFPAWNQRRAFLVCIYYGTVSSPPQFPFPQIFDHNYIIKQNHTDVFHHNHTSNINRADAPIIGYLMEYCNSVETRMSYAEDGHCNGELGTVLPPAPQRMNWDIPKEARKRKGNLEREREREQSCDA